MKRGSRGLIPLGGIADSTIADATNSMFDSEAGQKKKLFVALPSREKEKMIWVGRLIQKQII